MKDDRLYLDHIIKRIDRISRFVVDGREAYLQSEVLQDAVLRNFEVIGEAVRKISSELRQQYPNVPGRRWPLFGMF